MNLAERAAALADNWRRYSGFAWSGPPDDGRWCLVYTRHRDAELLNQVNAEVIDEELAEHLGPDLQREHHTHWAWGWLDGYALRVYDDQGAVTVAFAKWHQLQSSLEAYSCLDEERYGRRQDEALRRRLTDLARQEDRPEPDLDRACRWLFDQAADLNQPSELELRAALESRDE